MEPAGAAPGEPRRGAVLLAEALRAALTPLRVEAGETVVRQGDVGRGFYFVESGALDVVVTSEGGLRLPVARLGPGSHFGEMSLLVGTEVSADVVACEPSLLYAATSGEFDQLIRRDPQLMNYVAGELAVRLKQTNEQLAAQQQRQADLSKLISSRPSCPFKSDLPSFGTRMPAAVEEAAKSDLPLLITGERGAGKRALALHVHSESARRHEAVLVVDCRELPEDGARDQLFGDAHPQFESRFADHLGYLQAADRGTLILANINALPAEVQEALATFLRTHDDSSEGSRVAVRVIGTAPGPVEASGSEHGVCEALLQAFTGGHVIEMRPLRLRGRTSLAPACLARDRLQGGRFRLPRRQRGLGGRSADCALHRLRRWDDGTRRSRRVLAPAQPRAPDERHRCASSSQWMRSLQGDGARTRGRPCPPSRRPEITRPGRSYLTLTMCG